MAALLLLAVACGGDDSVATTEAVDDPATTSTSTPEPGGDGVVAQEGDLVAVHYVGTLDDGAEFDSSRPRGATLDFEIGGGGMIAGFDQGVRGMAVGEIKTVRIEPVDAYGEVDPALIIEVDISQVPEGTAAGDVLFNPNTGSPIPVISVEGDVVSLDTNHELAGETLTFEIEMVAINP